jgi:methylated-DNA-[protein]-cysteine S-methyltransferase
MSDAQFAVLAAPWGPVHIAATQHGVVAVESLATTESFLERLATRIDGSVTDRGGGPAGATLEAAVNQLGEYFAGRRRVWDLRLDLGSRPAWDRSVLLDGVGRVPWGSVTSYGRVARRIGRPGAARAVGGAVGRNPIGILIPCHRVVAGDGTLGGYGGDWFGSRELLLEVKRELLRIEQVELPARTFAL